MPPSLPPSPERLTDELVGPTLQATVDNVITAMCEFAEEQDSPTDPIAERLYAIAHALELAPSSLADELAEALEEFSGLTGLAEINVAREHARTALAHYRGES